MDMRQNAKLTPLQEFPLVSVVILNYKRLSALEQTIQSVVTQTYTNREIIVVDNHSEENVSSLVKRWGNDIRLIELPANLGGCGGRNAGLRESQGEIVITLDNDVSFASDHELAELVLKFQQRPDFHVIAFQLVDATTGVLRVREWCHPRNWQEFGQIEFETNFFVEGACAYRAEVLRTSGLYYEPLFIYNEGHDLTLRILDHGFRILYCPSIQARHLMSSETRSLQRQHYFFTRNYIWIAYKDYSYFAGICWVLPKLLMMLYFTLRTGCYASFFKGIWDGFGGLRNIERTPISTTTAKYFAELEEARPSLIFRFMRHKVQPQL